MLDVLLGFAESLSARGLRGFRLCCAFDRIQVDGSSRDRGGRTGQRGRIEQGSQGQVMLLSVYGTFGAELLSSGIPWAACALSTGEALRLR